MACLDTSEIQRKKLSRVNVNGTNQEHYPHHTPPELAKSTAPVEMFWQTVKTMVDESRIVTTHNTSELLKLANIHTSQYTRAAN